MIAYATGGVPDLVDSTRHGLLVPTGDMAALAEALVDAASDAKRLRTWGRDARALVESEHTLERQAARYVGLYASVLRRTAEAA